jgi:uncharacterized protein (DUF885 family)
MFRALTVGACALIAAAGPLAAAAADRAPMAAQREDSKLMSFLERAWQADLARDPTTRTRLGIKGHLDGWTSTTDRRDLQDAALARRQLDRLHKLVDIERLSSERILDYRVYEEILRDRLRQVDYRQHSYFFTRNTSDPYLEIPQLLISAHTLETMQDARQYISQINGLKRILDDAEVGTLARRRRGIVLPAFNFADIARNSRAFIAGRPCDAGPRDQSIWEDFQIKLKGMTLEPEERERLLQHAEAAIRDVMCPAYVRFAGVFARMGQGVTHNDGLWSLPGGDRLYREAIAIHTSMKIDPGQLHQTGLKEVERIETQIRGVMDRVAFHGSIREFFESMSMDPRYQLPQTEQGRAEYLAVVQKELDRVRQHLPELFEPSSIAQRPLVVRAVEPAREAALGSVTFYEPPHGASGPGIYYIGLADMSREPLWAIEATTYHEGLPGHHLQVSVATSLANVSAFRRHYENSAYQEGWGLYAESLGKELGGYTDDYALAGRYRLELLRAVRIVVETGFHHERWSWERCAAYLAEHQGIELEVARKDVTRYMVWPGQGVSYKLGELEIERLRAKAESALGSAFNLRGFHAVILDDGVLPFNLLGQRVDSWVSAQQQHSVGEPRPLSKPGHAHASH